MGVAFTRACQCQRPFHSWAPKAKAKAPFPLPPLSHSHTDSLTFTFLSPPFSAISALFPTPTSAITCTLHWHNTKRRQRKSTFKAKTTNKQNMSNKSPIFPMPEPQHFSDYGFDPQIDYFQVSLKSPSFVFGFLSHSLICNNTILTLCV